MYVKVVGPVLIPIEEIATVPLPLLLGSITETLGGDLYPNPPCINLISRIPPSFPMTGIALAPTPPLPEITTRGLPSLTFC